MSTLMYNYGDNPVDFGFNHDLLVNATEMVKIFDKNIAEFLRLPSTQKLISALERSYIRPYSTSDKSTKAHNDDQITGNIKHRSSDLVPLVIIRRGGEDGGSTWLHRYLAIELASWLDIDFKIWTLRIIDQLLSNYANARRELMIRKKNVDNEIQKILSETKNDEVRKLGDLYKEKDQIKGEEFNLNKSFKQNLKGN